MCVSSVDQVIDVDLKDIEFVQIGSSPSVNRGTVGNTHGGRRHLYDVAYRAAFRRILGTIAYRCR
jgi:hypothetical protein